MTTGRLPRAPRDHGFHAIGALESTTVRFSPTRRNGRRFNDLICYINVTPFVSVMLVLLYLFIVQRVDINSAHRSVPVDVAKVSSPVSMQAADREDAMIVGITRDDKVFFRNDQVTVDELPVKVRESVNQGSERKVYIRADARRSTPGLPRF